MHLVITHTITITVPRADQTMGQYAHIRRANKRKTKLRGIYQKLETQPEQPKPTKKTKKRRIRPTSWEKRGEESYANAAARLEWEREAAEKAELDAECMSLRM